MTSQSACEWLVQHSRETAYLKSINRLLSWDQRTQIPAKGQAHRAAQLSLLAGMIHERDTDPRVAEHLARVEGAELVQDASGVAAVNVREWRRNFDQATKIPQTLAVALAQAAAEAETVWEGARPQNDWETFRPYLERMVALKVEEAQALGYTQEPYDALLDLYEPGETAAILAPVFAQLREALVALLQDIQGSRVRTDRTILQRQFPAGAQEAFARRTAAAIGYDLAAGRLDPTAHPFSTSIGPGDARITTRYDEHDFGMAFFGVLHEAGHALYSQGLPVEHWGTPRGESISLGIHESQSRLWENFVGRSPGFWQHFFPLAQQSFPALKDVSLAAFHLAVNDVRPSLIRTEADEVTYNLHIIFRFELERALLRGEFTVAELPAAWNGRVKEFLGLDTPDFSHGVMQDVHWSGGHFGYFPTYTLGNLYAAQLFQRAAAEVGEPEARFAQGNFLPLLNWLREKIHGQGKRYWPRQLVQEATGEELNPGYLVSYLQEKFGALYDLK
jgi:carboxypeptidase Taq